jgi:hypothetical protein
MSNQGFHDAVGAVGAFSTPPPYISIYLLLFMKNMKTDPLHPLIAHGNAHCGESRGNESCLALSLIKNRHG